MSPVKFSDQDQLSVQAEREAQKIVQKGIMSSFNLYIHRVNLSMLILVCSIARECETLPCLLSPYTHSNHHREWLEKPSISIILLSPLRTLHWLLHS